LTEKRKYSDLTGRSRKKSIYKLATFLILLLGFTINSFSALLDRTVAAFGDKVVTYRDVEKSYLVNLIASGKVAVLYPAPEMEGEKFNKAREESIKYILVRMQLEKLALKGLVPASEIEREYEKFRKNLGNQNDLDKFCRYYETSPALIKSLLEKRLTSERFFERQSFNIVDVTDEEVKSYFESEKNDKFKGKTLEQSRDFIRVYLKNERQTQGEDGWLKEQMKKYGVRLIDLT
jgi:hypothetical protein